MGVQLNLLIDIIINMAGQADKKRQQKAAEYYHRHASIVLVVTVIFSICRFLLCRSQFKRSFFPLPSLSESLALIASYAIYCATYKNIVRSLQLGVSHTFATDFFLVACGAQVLGGIHPGGWCLWTVVPLYGLYRFIRIILKWVFTPEDLEPGSAAEAAAQRKREKMERKRRTGRIQLVR